MKGVFRWYWADSNEDWYRNRKDKLESTDQFPDAKPAAAFKKNAAKAMGDVQMFINGYSDVCTSVMKSISTS